MKQLSGLDATFLYLETPQMPMHVGALHLFELPSGYKGKFVTALRKHMALRLPVTPVLRRRLWWMPLNLANPAWVDAKPDLKHHVEEIKLPKGAGLAALEAEVAGVVKGAVKGSVAGAVRGLMGQAMKSAVSQVTGPQRVKPRASAPVKKPRGR